MLATDASSSSCTHLVKSPLEFMQRHTEWQLCGGQIRECCVGSGSRAVTRSRDCLRQELTSSRRPRTWSGARTGQWCSPARARSSSTSRTEASNHLSSADSLSRVPTEGIPMTLMLRPFPCAVLLCLFLAACSKTDTPAEPAGPTASPGYDAGSVAEPLAPPLAAASAATGPASAPAQASRASSGAAR
jgi:hypothetical protein